MKLEKVYLKNFRGYKDYTEIKINNITTLIGKNDVGKSTILEALDIFFNENSGLIKIDKNDVNIECKKQKDLTSVIGCVFSELPTNLILDTSVETNLQSEYMLTREGLLDIRKEFNDGASRAKVYIKAYHPNGRNCSDLLSKKQKELQKIICDNSIICDNCNCNSMMRKAIWKHYHEELDLKDVDIDISKGDSKIIWDRLKLYLPIYNLFQADRKNTETDNEVQDPLKIAVKEVLNEPDIVSELAKVGNRVVERLNDVSQRTIVKLHEMDPNLRDGIKPLIPEITSLKWSDVFKNVSITGDEGIPLNKRGSGFKRLVLLSFFRAEVERKIHENTHASLIYAFEEPESSQHWDNQKILISAFKELANISNTQVILTTHSADIVKFLDISDLRLIEQNDSVKEVNDIEEKALNYASLNEINYIAFGRISEEYHDELYSYIQSEGKLGDYGSGKPLLSYYKEERGEIKEKSYILSTKLRHQIHHPENNHNPKYTQEELSESIKQMREYILENLK